jgi:hypothetical protein
MQTTTIPFLIGIDDKQLVSANIGRIGALFLQGGAFEFVRRRFLELFGESHKHRHGVLWQTFLETIE